MNMKSRDLVIRVTVAGAMAASVVGSGCGHLRQARDHADAYAVPTVIAEQTLNPEAGNNRRAVAGLDGTAAKNVGDGYAKTFVRQEGQSTQSFQGLDALSSE
jgi:hypothetical protein